MPTFASFRGRAFLGTPYSSPYVAKLNKSVWSETRMLSAIGQIQTLVWQFFCPSFGRSFCRRERTQWHWSKHLKFRPSWIMTVPQRLSFFAQLPNCSLATFGALNYDHSPGCSFARWTVPSLLKNWTAHSEGGKKAGFFVTEGEWQRKPRFNSQGLYAWLRNE